MRYRAYYAGAANEGIIVDAPSRIEAAYTFFRYAPRRETMFVGRLALLEREVTYEELRSKHPEVEDLLPPGSAQRALAVEKLRRGHAKTMLWEVEEESERKTWESLRRSAIITAFFAAAYVAYRILR